MSFSFRQIAIPLALILTLAFLYRASGLQAQDRSQPPRELPLLVTEGRLIVPVTIEGGEEQFFILDTAASSSVISTRLRDRLEIDPSDVRRDTVRGASGQTVMENVLLPGVRVGEETFTDVRAVVVDLSNFRVYEGHQVEGILGVDVLQRYDVELDAASGVMRLYPYGALAEESRDGLPFASRTASGFVEFELTLNGQPVSGVLDSGAAMSVLNWQAAEGVGVRPGDPGMRVREDGTRGIDGGSTPTSLYTFEALEVGPARLQEAEVKIADLPVFEVLGIAEGPAMLVGVDALLTCRVRISYSTSRLHVCG